ncbi:zinc ribbon domain-containing protein [Halovivax gelatinilyticus]|uniref:zinc ribbon domain-containing protein n=1 Tax=Halovivax gelatinilyticus TaxID=2961597 RepID=UPI0020CA6CFE|nr:zinc ribbon domain-containing protein [Halovivax gelatinilyticus]
MTGITAGAAYAPRLRIAAEEYEEAWGRFQGAGIRETAVPAADEDALTMGYEAASRALDVGSVEPDDVTWLGFATTTPPVEEGESTSRLGEMLGIDAGASRRLFAGGTSAGTSAIWTAMDAADRDECALVVVADAPRGEPDDAIDHAAGAGAAAFVLTADGPAQIVDRASWSVATPGTRFRRAGERSTEGLSVTQYDRDAFTEAVRGAVSGLDGDPEPDAVAIQAPDGKLPYRAAGALGVDTDAIAACATVHDLGDLGAASVPVTLANALADGHVSILAVGYGESAQAVAIESDAAVPTAVDVDGEQPCTYAEYLRQRGDVTSGSPSGGGAYVSVPTWRRSIPQRYRLEAGRCPACEAISFPPEGACPDCRTLVEYEPVALPGTGTIESVTTISQGGAPPEFAEQQSRSGDYAAVVVAFDAPDGGSSVSAPAMGTDADPSAFAVGDRIEATIRRIYTQEGVTRYGFKVRPQAE